MAEEKIQSGRIEYLETLYTRYGASILRYLNRMVGPKRAEDVLQDTFVQALSYLDRLDGVNSPKAWLFRVAYNLAINELRKKKMVTGFSWDSLIQPATNEHPHIESMRKAIAQLPDEYRETIMLRWYDQLGYEEIAYMLQIPVGTVRSRLHYSLRRLRMQANVKMAVDP